jgi:hypothetical protein
VALADRLCGVTGSAKIPIHSFQAIVAEWARGNITGQQAQDGITAMSGTALSAGEVTEATSLVNSITSIPITGTAVQIADGRARRALRAQEIDQVLLLADARIAPYDVPATVKSRLGF